jgi:hypothetical protein
MTLRRDAVSKDNLAVRAFAVESKTVYKGTQLGNQRMRCRIDRVERHYSSGLASHDLDL